MSPTVRKLIAVLEIVGGLAGALAVTIEVAGKPAAPGGLLRASGLTTLFLFTLFAGVMLWRDTRTGRVCSLLAQCFQLPKILAGDSAFLVSYGLDVSVLAISVPGNWGVTFDIRVFTYYQLVSGPARPRGFGISLMACACISQLLARRRAQPVRPPDTSLPDSVTEFQKANEAIRAAKSRPAAEHPEWVTPRWLVALLITLGLFVVGCVGVSLLSGLFGRK